MSNETGGRGGGPLPKWTNRDRAGHLTAMRIVILSHADVSGMIAVTLMGRGHEVAFFGGGAVHAAALDALDGYDGCLLLGDAPEFAAFATAFRDRGKVIWREWLDIPPTPTPVG